jgi:methyl coenzyme M reductase subunit D
LHKDKDNKSIKIDSEKVDVEIKNGEVKVDVNEQSGLIGKLVKFLLRKK